MALGRRFRTNRRDKSGGMGHPPSAIRREALQDDKHEKALTSRELLLKGHEVASQTLLLFCTHFNERLPLEGLAGARLSVLIATAMKAINTSNAIRMLCVERPYFEEMYVLVRTLIESIVNGAFIQIAEDDEVNSFLHFDSISLSKSIRVAQTVSPEAVNTMSEKLRDEFRVHTDSIKQMIGKTEQDFSWTRLDIVSKGERIDRELGVPAFGVVCKVLFPTSHTYVHGGYRSLETYIHPERVGVHEDFFNFQADGALHHMDVALLALCITMNQLTDQRLDNWLTVIQSILVTYSEQIKSSMPRTYAAHGY
jgi:hypothetical protein